MLKRLEDVGRRKRNAGSAVMIAVFAMQAEEIEHPDITGIVGHRFGASRNIEINRISNTWLLAHLNVVEYDVKLARFERI